MTLKDMAIKINRSGCDIPFLSRFERGLAMADGIDTDLAHAISDAYGVRLRMTPTRVSAR
jgi:hypothetical protein